MPNFRNNENMQNILKIAVVAGILPFMTSCATHTALSVSENLNEMPPTAAFTACEGHREADLVTIDGLSGAVITATCKIIEGRLVAVPEGCKAE
ncbi:hypothetical protein JWG39_05170 [Desulforhopalus vacuolatus]|uniref:hypothetical protein n=1 Tax=Desulforhopalus vacuolatus TaxID=40414 RepID=UPI001964DC89|nr:hypothetical protein [Desulforhopalus vacuolatus]MBM9519210.1 hypothetical protein [Desulforhopalus vacuolatus]